MDQRAFYNPKRYADEEINEIVKCYNISEIDRRINSTIRFLEDIEQLQKACQQFLSASYYHRGQVIDTNVSYKVFYERSAYRGSNVKYYTGVYIIPCIPNGDKYKYSVENKQWPGKERHIAKKAAEALAVKYKCEIIKN